MTRIGVFGAASEKSIVDDLSWGDVRFGVDAVDDLKRHLAVEQLDVLVIDATVGFLTPDVLELCSGRVHRVVALARSESNAEWAHSFDGVVVVRNPTEVMAVAAPKPEHAPVASVEDGYRGNATAEGDSRLIVTWGPVGAPGITTAAISIATVCARAGLRVLVCDADTRGSSIAIALGLTDETPGLAAACRLAGREELTDNEVARLAVPYSRDGWSFDVLTGLPRASRWAAIEPAKLRTVLSTTRALYDLVVVDAGFGIEENDWVDDAPQRDGATRELLRLADRVVAVGHADAVGVARLIRALDEASDLCADPLVLLNAVAPHSGRDAIDAMARFTHHTVHRAIPRDSRGGVEDAVARSLSTASPWRLVVATLGLGTPPTKRRLFPRR